AFIAIERILVARRDLPQHARHVRSHARLHRGIAAGGNDEAVIVEHRNAKRPRRRAVGAHQRTIEVRTVGEIEHGRIIARRQANSRITASTASVSPAFATIFLTFPSRSARSTFSIFIASTTSMTSPAFMSWPSCTAIWRTSPGIGQRTNLLS